MGMLYFLSIFVVDARVRLSVCNIRWRKNLKAHTSQENIKEIKTRGRIEKKSRAEGGEEKVKLTASWMIFPI